MTVSVHTFEDLPYADRLADPAFRALSSPENRHPTKHTVAFATMTWAKAHLLEKAADLDRDASSFMWLDFGLAHVVTLQPVDWSAIEKTCPARPRICEMRATHPEEVADAREYYRFTRGKVASGALSVGRPYVAALRRVVHQEVERIIGSGRVSLEENLYGALSARHPELFECWFSDYFGILRNYVDIIDDIGCVLDNLTYCRDRGLHERALQIYHAVHRSLRRGLLCLRPDDFGRLLHDGFITAFYVDRSLAEQIARRITAIHRYAPSLREHLDTPLVRANLAYVSADLDLPELDWASFAALDDFAAWRSCF